MQIKVIIRQILIQAALTQILIFVWNYYAYQSLEQAAMSTAALVLFISLYGGALTILLLGRVGGISKMILVSALVSFLVTITFIFYPQLGLVVEWYVLFLFLFLAGLIAYGLSYESGGPNIEQDEIF
jgi:hypothetical protein